MTLEEWHNTPPQGDELLACISVLAAQNERPSSPASIRAGLALDEAKKNGALLPVVAEAEGIVSDTRATVGVVRADVEVLSGSVAALGEDVRHAATLAGERVARLNAALETLQEEFEGSVRATVRLLRTVRGGAQLLRRLLGARRRRRRPAPERDARGQGR